MPAGGCFGFDSVGCCAKTGVDNKRAKRKSRGARESLKVRWEIGIKAYFSSLPYSYGF